MKVINIVFLLICGVPAITAQNLDRMPKNKRDSLLIAVAKEVVLKFGPDYYREVSKPIVERTTIPGGTTIYFEVFFLYDKTEERLDMDFAAQVRFRDDTGKPVYICLGNGTRGQLPKDWRNTTIEPIPYEAYGAIKPVYPAFEIVSILIPEHIEEQGEQAIKEYAEREVAIKRAANVDPDPINKEELIRKGWIKNSNGEWVNTRPDVPPHRRGGGRGGR